MSIVFNKAYDYIMCSVDLNKIIEISKILSEQQILNFISMLEHEECVQSGIIQVLKIQLACVKRNICKL